MNVTVAWLGLGVSSAWMAAVGWYVGLVHYPTFHYVPGERWAEFHRMHTSMTGLLVVLPMVLQIVATVALVVNQRPGQGGWVWASLFCLALSVGWTGMVSGPIHGELRTFDPVLVDRLILTNWPRCVAWTAQAVISGFVLALSSK